VSVLYGDQPTQPDSEQIAKDAAHYQAIGMSPDSALARAGWESWWTRRGDQENKPERDARQARVEALQGQFWMAQRRGETHTLQEKLQAIHEASLVEDELERRRVDHERRRGEIMPPGQLTSGPAAPVPAPAPETPATRAARVRRRVDQILGPRPKKDSIAVYRSYKLSDPVDVEPPHISYR
jgi:hypothetical protein